MESARSAELDGLAKRNWGRWGPDDERGALNLLTPDKVIRAIGTVRRGIVLSLAHPIDRRTPMPHHRPAPSHFMTRDGGDGGDDRTPARTQFSDDTVLFATHTGTHVDALAHVWYGDELYNGFPKSVVRSKGGARRCGIDKLGPIVGRGVLLDVAGALEVEALPLDFRVSPDVLVRCLKRQDAAIEPGDIVVVRTGWWNRYAAADGQEFSCEPGVDVAGAAWLAERDVAAVGADNFAFELLPSGERARFPVHELLLRDCGIPIIEGLALDELARAGAYEFLCVVAPLGITGGTGSPANPVAVI